MFKETIILFVINFLKPSILVLRDNIFKGDI